MSIACRTAGCGCALGATGCCAIPAQAPNTTKLPASRIRFLDPIQKTDILSPHSAAKAAWFCRTFIAAILLRSKRGAKPSSVDQFERKLNLSRSPGRLADFAESGAGKNIGRQPHVHNVEEIEELSPELQVHAFGPA